MHCIEKYQEFRIRKGEITARYWVIQNDLNQAFIVNHKPVVGVNGVKEIHWFGFSETEANYQLRSFDRIISLCD